MEQNTQEWLDFRRNKIGASDASCIMGINPWKTSYQLWEEKVFGKEQEQNGAMKRGSMMEDAARIDFEKQTGISVMPKVVVSPDRPWQMASLDGVSFDGSTFVEIKCPNKETHDMALAGVVPDHYYTQMQHQMSVLKANEGLYFSFDGRKGKVVTVKRDEKYIDEMLGEEEKFYECMISQTAPALSGRDYRAREDAEWNDTAKEWLELSNYIKSLEEGEKELRGKLIAMSQNQSSKGAGVRLTRSMSKGLIDYKNAATLLGIDFEPFRKPSYERWTLSACK
jgi:putative phage-type endonuclease